MSQEIGAIAFDELDEQAFLFFTGDSRMSLMRALALLEMSEETLAIFDMLSESAITQSTGILNVALEQHVEITSPLAAIVLQNLIYNWKEGGASGFYITEDFLQAAWPEAVSSSEDREARMLNAALEATGGLALLESAGSIERDAAARTANGLTELARIVNEAGHADEALACILKCRALHRLPKPSNW